MLGLLLLLGSRDDMASEGVSNPKAEWDEERVLLPVCCRAEDKLCLLLIFLFISVYMCAARCWCEAEDNFAGIGSPSTMRISEKELRSSGLAASAFTCSAFPLAPE